jgi:hypothetical protein
MSDPYDFLKQDTLPTESVSPDNLLDTLIAAFNHFKDTTVIITRSVREPDSPNAPWTLQEIGIAAFPLGQVNLVEALDRIQPGGEIVITCGADGIIRIAIRDA